VSGSRLRASIVCVRNHLLESAGRCGRLPSSQWTMTSIAPGRPQRFLVDIVERCLESLEVRGAIAESSGPCAPVVRVIQFWNDHNVRPFASRCRARHRQTRRRTRCILLSDNAERFGVTRCPADPANRRTPVQRWMRSAQARASCAAHQASGPSCDVVRHAMAANLMAGLVEGLYRLGHFSTARRWLQWWQESCALEISQPPCANRSSVIGVRKRGDVDGNLGRLLETSALAKAS